VKTSRGTVTFGTEAIDFQILYVKRRTLEIAVYPGKTVIVRAPLDADFSEVRSRVEKRAGWIKRQVDFFRQFDPRTPTRRYVSGETHLYMGRRYRLKIGTGQKDEVKLLHAYFVITIRGKITVDRVKKLMDDWHREKAKDRFEESLDRCWPAFADLGPERPRTRVRRMNTRWGTLSANGMLTLNIDLIRAPRECIDYVVTHELSHLKYTNHGKDFRRLLESVMPDWEKRKHSLEISLA